MEIFFIFKRMLNKDRNVFRFWLKPMEIFAFKKRAKARSIDMFRLFFPLAD